MKTKLSTLFTAITFILFSNIIFAQSDGNLKTYNN